MTPVALGTIPSRRTLSDPCPTVSCQAPFSCHLVIMKPVANIPRLTGIIVEALVTGKDDPDLVWLRQMLLGFRFWEIGNTTNTHQTKRGKNSEWLDNYIWQHNCNAEAISPESDPGLWEGGIVRTRAKYLPQFNQA